jgi:hypothetical protein
MALTARRQDDHPADAEDWGAFAWGLGGGGYVY